MMILRQSTAVDVLIGPFVGSDNGDDEETALTIEDEHVLLSKNGQALAAKNDDTTCVHDADGYYNCELNATDTNTVGTLVLAVHVADALAVRHEFQVVEEAVYDKLFASGAALNDLAAADMRTALGLASADLDTQLAAIPTLTELLAEIASGDDAVLTAIATLNDPDATAIATAVWDHATRTLSALGFTLGASDLAADTIGASELAADAITEIVNGVWTTALTEAYNADGAAPTGAQALFFIMQRMVEFAISGTTITVKKLDGSTTAYTLTLDDANSPTSSTRAT